MRFGTWNVRSQYRAGLLMTVASEISNYKLDLVGVQEVRWDGWYRTNIFLSKGMRIVNYVQVSLYKENHISS
jgi:hypothetical protein